MPEPGELSRMLHGVGPGGEHRADELLPLVYDELRSLARARLARERPGQTLQATSLVHEAYLRVVGSDDPGWNGRGHFFGAAAQAMRRILVEAARRKARLKHGGELERVELAESQLAVEAADSYGSYGSHGAPGTGGHDVLAVDEALRRLEKADPRKGRIVELRYFGGLTNEETARVLGLSVGTIEREWRFIRTWLQTELGGGAGGR